MKNLALIGGGGHCCSCIDVIESVNMWKIEAIVDLPEKHGKRCLDYKINASDDDLPALVKEGFSFLITLGQIKTPQKRKLIFDRLKALNAHFPVITSPTAYVSKYAFISEGTVVLHHAIVNVGARIGNNCIINTKALIEHDAVISDHCHIATSAIINGGVKVGEGSFIGSQAVIKENTEIGNLSIVGVGARIVKNINGNQIII